jgi:hypothetical protein
MSLSTTNLSLGGVQRRQLASQQPPSYAPSGSALHGPANPTNYIKIYRPGGIKESFIIDCDFQTPEFLRPQPFQRGEIRNLELQSTGNIDVEITIVGSLHNQNRVSLAASVGNSKASITVKVVCGHVTFVFSLVQPFLKISSTVPFVLDVTTLKGDAAVFLPRSFRGKLWTRGCSGHDVSALSERLTLFNELGHEFQYFVGVIPSWAQSQKEWKGDECRVSANNYVRVGYVYG